ncbi:MAG: hypothetical protein EBU88_10470 [Acidobacteria bacterium]|nr:hypothetical protein [Acidobacteriota bacterium]
MKSTMAKKSFWMDRVIWYGSWLRNYFDSLEGNNRWRLKGSGFGMSKAATDSIFRPKTGKSQSEENPDLTRIITPDGLESVRQFIGNRKNFARRV